PLIFTLSLHDALPIYGLPTAVQLTEGRPRAPHQNFVKTLMRERPDILKAAAACQAAMNELWDLGVNDLGRRNIGRMMEINFGLQDRKSTRLNSSHLGI